MLCPPQRDNIVPPASFGKSTAHKWPEVDGKFARSPPFATTWPRHAKFDSAQVGGGPEAALLDYVNSHPEIERFRGDPAAILRIIDEFSRSVTGLVIIRQPKGAIITDIVSRRRPVGILELGGYAGYSATMFAAALQKSGGTQYYSVEMNPEFSAVASSLIELAGLKDMITVVVGKGAEGIQRPHDSCAFAGYVDMVFIDHGKADYTSDLKLCESFGLIEFCTVIVADNMIWPGNPDYVEWVRSSVAEKEDLDKSSEIKGNPKLEYSSRSIESVCASGHVDAMEVTMCLGMES